MIDEIKKFLRYHPVSGRFEWIADSGKCRYAGKEAGSAMGNGYVAVTIFKTRYYCHRLAWAFMTGAFPSEQIDHINGVKSDNRWTNLREATPTLNSQNNRRARKHNKTGFLGVVSVGLRFKARIGMPNRKIIYLGTFDTPQEAHDAYVDGKRKLHAGCTL